MFAFRVPFASGRYSAISAKPLSPSCFFLYSMLASESYLKLVFLPLRLHRVRNMTIAKRWSTPGLLLLIKRASSSQRRQMCRSARHFKENDDSLNGEDNAGKVSGADKTSGNSVRISRAMPNAPSVSATSTLSPRQSSRELVPGHSAKSLRGEHARKAFTNESARNTAAIPSYQPFRVRYSADYFQAYFQY